MFLTNKSIFMLSFRKTKISEIDWENYFHRDWDVGSNYCGHRFQVYFHKPSEKFYLIKFLYDSFGSDNILISNQEIPSNIYLKPFETLEIDIDNIQ